MKFGISLPPFGDHADPRYLANIAREAEDAGWDGFFLWDHVVFDTAFRPNLAPWVGLAAIAMNTQKMNIGTLVTPVARRRPWQLARETVSVDRLSNGRLILGVGLGVPAELEYGAFGEEADPKIHGQKLDEGLAILDGLWSGEPFSYKGDHFNVDEVRFLPRAIQSPRIPVWVGGTLNKRRPLERAARWDGYCPLKDGGMVTPDEWKVTIDSVNRLRTSSTPFDWVHGGETPGENLAKAAEMVKPYEDVGVTWWIEGIYHWRYGLTGNNPITPEISEAMNERIRQGPPRS